MVDRVNSNNQDFLHHYQSDTRWLDAQAKQQLLNKQQQQRSNSEVAPSEPGQDIQGNNNNYSSSPSPERPSLRWAPNEQGKQIVTGNVQQPRRQQQQQQQQNRHDNPFPEKDIVIGEDESQESISVSADPLTSDPEQDFIDVEAGDEQEQADNEQEQEAIPIPNLPPLTDLVVTDIPETPPPPTIKMMETVNERRFSALRFIGCVQFILTVVGYYLLVRAARRHRETKQEEKKQEHKKHTKNPNLGPKSLLFMKQKQQPSAEQAERQEKAIPMLADHRGVDKMLQAGGFHHIDGSSSGTVVQDSSALCIRIEQEEDRPPQLLPSRYRINLSGKRKPAAETATVANSPPRMISTTNASSDAARTGNSSLVVNCNRSSLIVKCHSVRSLASSSASTTTSVIDEPCGNLLDDGRKTGCLGPYDDPDNVSDDGKYYDHNRPSSIVENHSALSPASSSATCSTTTSAIAEPSRHLLDGQNTDCRAPFDDPDKVNEDRKYHHRSSSMVKYHSGRSLGASSTASTTTSAMAEPSGHLLGSDDDPDNVNENRKHHNRSSSIVTCHSLASSSCASTSTTVIARPSRHLLDGGRNTGCLGGPYDDNPDNMSDVSEYY